MFLCKMKPRDSEYYHEQKIINNWTHKATLKRKIGGHSSKWPSRKSYDLVPGAVSSV